MQSGSKRSAFVVALASFTLSLGLVTAHAAPINYVEAVNGDLPQAGSPLPTFLLDLGQNMVAGSQAAGDFDSFAFTIPAGDQMLGGSITMFDQSGDWLYSTWRLCSGSANSSTGTKVGDYTASSPGTVALPILGAGTYHFTNTTGAYNANAVGGYHFVLTVVPEPSTSALLSLGAIGAGSLALRRRQTRA